ncbi:hypothetical protein [Marinobacter pelagius]|uniref:Sulfotransferase family protein n=1 Tax=Marinobacter pelagius TaxID=379482 RepID=A0A1I4U1I7_9GAMM|nr:hypothetical protein [Marinobacter pelagius]SFM82739.1 hypothetical protein SAMN04487961_1395 [Marinobacter pelagius]
MLYLHIGVGKAGSTTIQNFLYFNFSSLLPYVEQLESFGIGDAWRIAAASQTELSYNYWVKKSKKFTPEEYEKFANEFWDSVAAEVRQSDSNHFIASSEHIFSQYGFDADKIMLLREHLLSIFGEVRIIFYCRPQISWAKSFYSQIIKGPTSGIITYDQFVDEFSVHSYHWNYYKGLSLWADAFGDENIVARVFHQDNFMNGNLIHDFLSALELDGLVLGFEMPLADSNISPKPKRLELVRKINKFRLSPLLGQASRIAKRVILSDLMKWIDNWSGSFSKHRDADILKHIDAGNRAFNDRFLSGSEMKLPVIK